MLFRVAMLTDPYDVRIAPLWEALTASSAEIEIHVLRHPHPARPGPDTPLRLASTSQASKYQSSSAPTEPRFIVRGARPALLDLVAVQPHLVICEDFGWSALLGALFRSMSRRSRLLLFATEVPRQLGLRQRWILRKTDGVFADGQAAVQAVERLKFPPSRIFPTAPHPDLESFFACRRMRSDTEARRLVFVGDLTPGTGAADLLINVIAWAEQNPTQPVQIWWAGDGDLAGVLDAQPLPPGVSQRFMGQLEPREMAAAFAQCGLLIVPSFNNDRRAPVLEGLAAGLPVLGSQLNRRVLHLVRDDVNGWLFNPLEPDGLAQALNRAMSIPLGALEQMRDHAQAAACPSEGRGLGERFSSALAAVMPELVQNALSQPAP